MMATTYLESVRASLSTEDTEHLLNKVRFGGLTDEAHGVALEVLAHRKVDISALPSSPVSEESTAPKYWKLTDEERWDRRYRMYGIASILLLPFWTLACSLVAMDLAYKHQQLGIAIGWATLLAAVLPMLALSLKAWWTVSKSTRTHEFVGRSAHVFWMLSIGASALWFSFSLYGVVTEAYK
jgi:hypothetical protein